MDGNKLGSMNEFDVELFGVFLDAWIDPEVPDESREKLKNDIIGKMEWVLRHRKYEEKGL